MHRLRSAVAAVLLVALAAGTTACDGSSTGNSPAHHVTTATSTSTSPTTAMIGTLPVFTTEASVEQAMRRTIAMAARYTKGVSPADQSPRVVTIHGHSCLDDSMAVTTCPPSSATAPIIIQINPEVAWVNYQQQNAAGGDTPWQSMALEQYDTYLMFRQLQRSDSSLLTSTDNANAYIKSAHTMACFMGATYAGLRPAMSSRLAGGYLNPMPVYQRDEAKGKQGLCKQYP